MNWSGFFSTDPSFTKDNFKKGVGTYKQSWDKLQQLRNALDNAEDVFEAKEQHVHKNLMSLSELVENAQYGDDKKIIDAENKIASTLNKVEEARIAEAELEKKYVEAYNTIIAHDKTHDQEIQKLRKLENSLKKFIKKQVAVDKKVEQATKATQKIIPTPPTTTPTSAFGYYYY